MDAKRTENVYSDYAWSPHNQEIQKFKDTHLARQDRMFSDAALRHIGSLPKGEQKLVIRRLVAEFAFEAASSQAYRYIVLFPHNTLGRYPKNLPDGSSTTEIYESRPDIVLHRVYNETRINFEMLCEYSSKLDNLCGLCSEHGYW